MRKAYYKDGIEVARPQSLVLNGNTYVPPTDEQLEQAGYEIREIIEPIPEPYIPTYAELVEQYIREHGYPTYGAELAVLNNYAESPTEYAEAYAAYVQCRKDAKAWANEQPHREESAE